MDKNDFNKEKVKKRKRKGKEDCMKNWGVRRITYSSIVIQAKTRKEADDMIGEIDGDDDNWSYYDEEFYLIEIPDGKETSLTVEYDEYSQTHTVNRDD